MKTARYLNWLGYTARVFNTGEYGRIQVEKGETWTGEREEEKKKPGFDHYSKEATNECQTALWEWLGEGGQIGRRLLLILPVSWSTFFISSLSSSSLLRYLTLLLSPSPTPFPSPQVFTTTTT
jgi:hypothetical protein